MECGTVVVGAGIQGSAAAYYLVKSGLKQVVLLEQFERNHSRGSSHGHTRITRLAYKKPFYVPMMRDAFQLWSDLEQRSGTTLFKQTGYLVFGPGSEPYIMSTMESLRENGISHHTFSGLEANQRYPRQLKLPSTHKCFYEEVGGILYAEKALRAFQQEFIKLGGTLLDCHQVTEIIPGESVTVVTNRGSFKTRNVVIAAGPWAPTLCSSIGVHLPLKGKRVEALYWKVDNPSAYSSDVFPTTIGFANGTGIYSVPVDEYPNMIKVCSSNGVWADADNRDIQSGPVTVHEVSEFIKSTYKGVADTPSIIEYCMYTVSPDYDPVIDRHPEHDNIIIAAGFTGHGFKISPVVGKVISELVRKETPSHNMHPFRVSRFLTPQSGL